MSLVSEEALEDTYVMHTFGRKPVEFVRGKGMRLYDDAGKEYIDFLSGIGVVSLGHCHQALVNTLQQQTEKLMHVSNYYYIEGRGELACKLSNLLSQGIVTGDDMASGITTASSAGSNVANPNLESDASATTSTSQAETWQTFFANSGAEANECAIKLARLYARLRSENPNNPCSKRVIVTLERSFHGRTLATLAATAQPVKQEIFQPLPDGFIATPANDIAALEQLFAQQGSNICAVLLEPVQGECGVYPCSKEFMEKVRELTTRYNALFMCDEVQCGLYRCGTYPFAFQHSGITPDVVTMAKGIAGGVPMGACAAKASIAKVFEPGIHGSTFGGSNLAISAANCVLDTIIGEGLPQKITEVGSYFKERLQKLSHVQEVRGLGLMLACEFDESIDAPELVLKALEAGLVLNATGPHTLRFLPPLICTHEDIDAMITQLQLLL